MKTSYPDYITGPLADSHFPVTGARIYGRELRVGDTYWGAEVLSILFYTGFAGCPARYYIRTTRSTTIANATGIYVERLNRSEYQDLPGNTRGPLWPAEMR
jgi:hypothetical protein